VVLYPPRIMAQPSFVTARTMVFAAPSELAIQS
jgi:hypothetical protein